MYVELTDEQKAAQVRFSQNLPRSVPRYHPLSSRQERRLMDMYEDETFRQQFWKCHNSTDDRWMQRLEKRGLVMRFNVFGLGLWRLTKQGELLALRLFPF